MKKILLVAVVISVAFAACKKDSSTQPEKAKIQKKVLDGEEDGGDKRGDGGDWE